MTIPSPLTPAPKNDTFLPKHEVNSNTTTTSTSQTLLQLVSRGSNVITNLRKMSMDIPFVFISCSCALEDLDDSFLFHPTGLMKGQPSSSSSAAEEETNGKKEESKWKGPEDKQYHKLLFTFSYLRSPEKHEERLRDCYWKDAAVGSSAQTSGYASPSLSELEADFQSTYHDAVLAYYELFASVYEYQHKLHSFMWELMAGLYIPYTLESLLLEDVMSWDGAGGDGTSGDGNKGGVPGGGGVCCEGRQLLCEAVYLYGLMLLLLERHYPGGVRERLIIAFLRYGDRESVNKANLDQLCKLCKATRSGGVNVAKSSKRSSGSLWSMSSTTSSANSNSKKSIAESNQTDSLFVRFPLPPDLIQNLIHRLIANDLYLQHSYAFPNLHHRSTRLARQASMLYVILFFSPNTLQNEAATMREIVDRFFSDNWILSPPQSGFIVDLQSEWNTMEAAQTALDNVLRLPNVTRLHAQNAKLCHDCLEQCKLHLTKNKEWKDQFVLDHATELLNLVRRCNVALRWRMLHRRVTNTEFASVICSTKPTTVATTDNHRHHHNRTCSTQSIILLLLYTSTLELKLKNSFTNLLSTKQHTWSTSRDSAQNQTMELSEYFSGNKALTRVSRDESLMKWFSEMSHQISTLNHDHTQHISVTGRNIQQCIRALEDVERFDKIDTDLHVKLFLKDTRALLTKMVKAVSIQPAVLGVMNLVTDLSYAWDVIGSREYRVVLQQLIQSDPNTTVLLHPFFRKLMDAVLLNHNPRIKHDPSKQNEGAHVVSPLSSAYYVEEVSSFIRHVMNVIPVSVFGVLLKIVDYMERRLNHIPIRVEVDSVKDYAQPKERYDLARLTHEVSIFTQGIFTMEKSNNTTMNIHPRQILENGIRKELVLKVSQTLHHTLFFTSLNTTTINTTDVKWVLDHRNLFFAKISHLAARMDGFQKAIEYIQDYVGIAGLKIWVEEFHRIIGFNVEQEGLKYSLRRGQQTTTTPPPSKYQSKSIPIPAFPRLKIDPTNLNFMGRTMSSLLRFTDAQTTIYSRECSGWFLRDGTELCGVSTFALLYKAMGVAGLKGLDRLLSLRIAHELQRYVAFYKSPSGMMKQSAVLLEQIRDGLFPEWKDPKEVQIDFAASSSTSSSIASSPPSSGKTPKNAQKLFYSNAIQQTEKLTMPLLTCLRRIGQAQLLRKMIRNELQFHFRMDSNSLYQAVNTLDKALLVDVQDYVGRSSSSCEDNCSKPISSEFDELSQLCHETSCTSDPMSTIFANLEPLESLPVLLLMFILSNVSKLTYDSDFGALIRIKGSYPLDGWPLVAGTATLLKQFHPSYAKSVLAYLGQYVRATLQNELRNQNVSSGGGGSKQIVPISLDVRHAILFASQLCSISNVPRTVLYEYIPQFLMELCSGEA